jgi:hypothetical protein
VKNYFLVAIADVAKVREALGALLPGQTEPWLIPASAEDPIAYLHLSNTAEDGPAIHADMSGRHYDEDERVLAVLRALRDVGGGAIRDDDGNEV